MDSCTLGVIKHPGYQATILLWVHIEGAVSRSQKESIPWFPDSIENLESPWTEKDSPHTYNTFIIRGFFSDEEPSIVPLLGIWLKLNEFEQISPLSSLRVKSENVHNSKTLSSFGCVI